MMPVKNLVACIIYVMITVAIANAQQFMNEIAPSTDIKSVPKCIASAQARYPKGPKINSGAPDKGACYEEINRAAAVSPPSLVARPGTRIFVRIKNRRQNEILQPTLSFGKMPPPDIATDILKNAVNPFQAITANPELKGVPPAPPSAPAATNPCDKSSDKSTINDAAACQQNIRASLQESQVAINNANAALACLESYQVGIPPGSTSSSYTCSPSQLISAANFRTEKQNVVTLIAKAVNPTQASDPRLPTWQLNNLDWFLSPQGSDKASICEAKHDSCNDLVVNQGMLKAWANNIQSAQATIQQQLTSLNQIPDNVADKLYYFDVPSLTTVTATVTGIEVVSKTSSAIATWTVSSVTFPFVFSTGLGFSNLVYRTFNNTPLMQNGVPVVGSNGNALSVVTESDTKLSVMAPEVLGSYLIPGLSKLEVKCSFGCSLLVSGGIGANLTTKSADFDTGLSIRIANFLLTPAIHFGRESRLIDGITVGSQLGPSAPSTLPTETKWVRKFGIVFSYVIPLT